MSEAVVTAWCMGTTPHPEHTFGSGEWCPGLIDPDEVTYQLRPGLPYMKMPAITLDPGTDAERFPQAAHIADALGAGNWDIWRIAQVYRTSPALHPEPDEHYIRTSGDYWRDPAGICHGMTETGCCWTCYQATAQVVRHPITLSEVLEGTLLPAALPDGDPCKACGGGYRHWITGELPAGYEYIRHLPGCQIMSGEKTDDDYR